MQSRYEVKALPRESFTRQSGTKIKIKKDLELALKCIGYMS